MSDAFDVEIKGFEALQDNLRRLADEAPRKIISKGLSQGGDALRQAMMDECGSALPGEPGKVASQKSSWTKKTKMTAEHDGRCQVNPKGKLVRLHKALHHKVWHKGMQPAGSFYFRSLNYLLKLAEFGASGGKERGLIPKCMPMTRGFERNKGKVLERVIEVIKEALVEHGGER